MHAGPVPGAQGPVNGPCWRPSGASARDTDSPLPPS